MYVTRCDVLISHLPLLRNLIVFFNIVQLFFKKNLHNVNIAFTDLFIEEKNPMMCSTFYFIYEKGREKIYAFSKIVTNIQEAMPIIIIFSTSVALVKGNLIAVPMHAH